jgi:DNA invertase Pin-like site-specific DNA recombinase
MTSPFQRSGIAVERSPSRRTALSRETSAKLFWVIPKIEGETPSVLGYRRVSSREQAAEWKASLQAQTDAQVQFAAQKRLPFDPRHTFEDRFSAEDAEKRHAFMTMFEYCETHPRTAKSPGHILVLGASRWGRFDNPDDAAYWRVRFRRLYWNVVYVTTDVSDDPGVSHVLRAVVDTGATFERNEIIRRAKSGGRNTAELGHWQGRAPLGYRRSACAPQREPYLLDNGEAKPADRYCVLVPGPTEEWEFMKWVFETFAKGNHSLSSFVKIVAEKRKTVGPGGSVLRPDIRWSKQALRQKLQNISYLGTIRYGRRLNQNRDTAMVVDDDDCVIVKDAHPALISPDVFDQVQARLAKNATARRGVVTPYALSGVVTCAECGSPLRGKGGKRGPAGKENRFRMYMCIGRLPGPEGELPKCGGTGGTVSRIKLETAVIQAITDLVQDPGIEDVIRGTLRARLSDDGTGSRARSRALKADQVDLTERRRRLVEAVEQGTLPHADVRTRLAEIDTHATRVRAELERVARAKGSNRSIEAEIERLLAVARDFPKLCSRIEGQDLRELLKPWIQSARFDKRSRVLTLCLRRVPGETNHRARRDHVVVRRFYFEVGAWWAKDLGNRREPLRAVRTAGGRSWEQPDASAADQDHGSRTR